jgi:hypothetical protein
MGTKAKLVRFEDLITHLKDLESDAAAAYFADLLGKCGIAELPSDWRERVRVGSDRKQSGTARENLAGEKFEIPDELPAMQKQLVDVAAPGLRSLLGYT